MRHITVSVEDHTYRQIRAWCAQRDTCVSHVVQAFLNDLPRLEHVETFPLPVAPDPGSLAAYAEAYRLKELEEIQRTFGIYAKG